MTYLTQVTLDFATAAKLRLREIGQRPCRRQGVAHDGDLGGARVQP